MEILGIIIAAFAAVASAISTFFSWRQIRMQVKFTEQQNLIAKRDKFEEISSMTHFKAEVGSDFKIRYGIEIVGVLIRVRIYCHYFSHSFQAKLYDLITAHNKLIMKINNGGDKQEYEIFFDESLNPFYMELTDKILPEKKNELQKQIGEIASYENW